MEPNIILYIILGIVSIEFLFETWLDFINMRNQPAALPDRLRDIYDEEKYKKSIEYQRARYKFSTLTGFLDFIIIFGLLASGTFGWFADALENFFYDPVWISLIFFGALFLLSDILHLPFQLYSTFVIEERFGFNKTSPKTFFVDKIKGYLLTSAAGAFIPNGSNKE